MIQGQIGTRFEFQGEVIVEISSARAANSGDWAPCSDPALGFSGRHAVRGQHILCRVAAVVGDNAAELPLVADHPFACEPKAGVKHLVPDVDALVRTLGVVIVEPDVDDVVQLLEAEAAEMVQARMLEPSNN